MIITPVAAEATKQPQLSGVGGRGTLGVYTKTLHGVAHLGGGIVNA